VTSVSRLDTLLDRLQKFYGALPAPPRDPFTLFVWEVLSVHSTPRKRDAALAALKRIRALTPDAMSRAAHAKLEASVALAGPYAEQRLRALKTGVDLFRRSPALTAVIKGPLPAARRALKPFPQLGEAGAHRMLSSRPITRFFRWMPRVSPACGSDTASRATTSGRRRGPCRAG
jgi:hypothetical protein